MADDGGYGGAQQSDGGYSGAGSGNASGGYVGVQSPPSPYQAKTSTVDDAGAQELAAARQTLEKSARTANMFKRSLGGLGARGHFVPTVLSNLYWFAKLYELITYYEIDAAPRLKYPSFLLRFIPIFYDMYYDALDAFQTQNKAGVSALWQKHFDASSGSPGTSLSGWMSSVTVSINTGVSAHIQGDMDTALVSAFKSYAAKYPKPTPTLDMFKDDFFARNRPVFNRVEAEFFLDLSNLGPFPVSPELGQFIIGVGAKGGSGLDLDEVFAWREVAWQSAKAQLHQP